MSVINRKNVICKLTKLTTTIGPTSEQEDKLKELFLSGSTCVRLNFSHGDHKEHLGRALKTRQLIQELNMPISIMLDTKGPEIRSGDFECGKACIEKGSEIIIDCFKRFVGNEHKFYVEYEHLIKDVKPGSLILLDDGKLQLQVREIKNNLIHVCALNTHTIKNHRGVNLPGTILSLPFLSVKDKQDLEFACINNLDFIALSFVRNKQDILDVRKFIKDFPNSQKVKLISKIESQQSINCLDEIIEESDMIMIARGDLGIEIPYEQVPIYEKLIISKCIQKAKPVIVATQMLDSMTKNPNATRAEVMDVFMAVELGTSSTMLSAESANGDYPVLATYTMANIAKTAEAQMFNNCGLFSCLLENQKNENIKKIIKEVANKKINTLIAINPKYGEITKIASLHLPLQIVIFTNDKDMYTKYGIHFGTKTIFVDNINNLDTKKMLSLINQKDYIDSSMSKIALLENNFLIKNWK